MIILVENEREQREFDKLWMKVWDEKGFQYEKTEGDAYLLYVDGRPAGTAQFTPYDPFGSEELNRVFDFSRIDRIRRHHRQVFVIDKFAIAKEYRSSSALDLLMYNLFDYAETRQKLFAIALLDPLLYRLIRFHYHFRVEKVGERTMYKGAEVIPVLIDSNYFLNRKWDYDWYRKAAVELGGEKHLVPEMV
ncbi:GNAT family N-acetyltransferase [Paenibacillus paeoniae]|uniref:N-acetyltransferase domain-containing protein n=1 Tax=Paenibacillus paeoniae TaxID=2292705 RepID=A0A371PK47_9BACL|nr:GNAT family N-acetyltransferase [Paenibacillus paeoniae]REK76029.1 hypothetical protein DX130_02900 [Paenibacillus paeoniae]